MGLNLSVLCNQWVVSESVSALWRFGLLENGALGG